MNRLQLLLCKLAEESAEVTQITLKTQQFGLNESREGKYPTNAERMHQELDDIQASIEMLNEEFGFCYVPNRERIEAKKLKVNKYADYAQTLGMVSNVI